MTRSGLCIECDYPLLLLLFCVLAFHFGYKVRTSTLYVEVNGRAFPFQFQSRQGLEWKLKDCNVLLFSYELQIAPFLIACYTGGGPKFC